MKAAIVAFVCAGFGGAGVVVAGCGGSDATSAPSDASTDSSATGDGTTGQDSASGDGGIADASDAGPPCAPPADPTKSSLCIRIAPEAIQFLANDPSLDGKGFMVVDVHDVANPDQPDGAPIPPLQQRILPGDGGADAGELDLSAAVPTIRFDGLSSTVYPRVVFVDARGSTKVGAGWWLGGYDFTNGFQKPALLTPVTLTPGVGTTITIDLTALRRLHVTLTRSATPIGNAMGPASVVATPDLVPVAGSKLFGVGANPCAKVNGALTAEVNGFVLGKGPYYALAQLDDFGTGGFFAPGSLISLEIADGGVRNPASSQLTYAANAYVVAHTVDLDLTVPKPDAGVDTVVCP